MYKYFPHTEEDLQEMLKAAGAKSVHDFFDDVPEVARFKREYELPEALSETDLRLLYNGEKFNWKGYHIQKPDYGPFF